MIELVNVGKEYGKRELKFSALTNVSLTIEQGELIAIMGKSGSGKSTLLNILGGLDRPTTGEYVFKNRNLHNLGNKTLSKLRNKSFGFVVQHFALIDYYTVYQNIMIPLDYTKISAKNKKKRVLESLEMLGLQGKNKRYPSELSGGESQRVAIARALINQPEIILADEPTGNLDATNSKHIMHILKKLNNSKTTVIIVTHDLEIAKNCDRIIYLENGEIV